MRTLFDEARLREVLDRLALLSADAEPVWGQMSAHRAVCHLSAQLAHALGELATAPVPGPMSKRPLSWLVIHAMPWPKGSAESPPEFLRFEPSSFAADLAELRARVERLAAERDREAWPVSPVFGSLTGKDYGVLCYRHLDHHLTQFGA